MPLLLVPLLFRFLTLLLMLLVRLDFLLNLSYLFPCARRVFLSLHVVSFPFFPLPFLLQPSFLLPSPLLIRLNIRYLSLPLLLVLSILHFALHLIRLNLYYAALSPSFFFQNVFKFFNFIVICALCPS